MKTKVAIIGSGNIGTDLMIKILQTSDILEMAALVGIDPNSDGLARAKKMAVAVTDKGIDGLVAMPDFKDIEILFDATSAKAHAHHDKVARKHGKQIIDCDIEGRHIGIRPEVELSTPMGLSTFQTIGTYRNLKMVKVEVKAPETKGK